MLRTFTDIDLDLDFFTATYRGHTLTLSDFTSTGFAAAAWLATALVATEEGEQRGVARLATDEQRHELMQRYEDETYREDGGLLRDEAAALHLWLQKLGETEDWLGTLFFSFRQYRLWQELCRDYMARLVERELAEEDATPIPLSEQPSFMAWLMARLARQSKLMMMRRMNWLDPESVAAFVAQIQQDPDYMEGSVPFSDLITHLEHGTREQALFEEYFDGRRMEQSTRADRPTDDEWKQQEQVLPYSEDEAAAFSPVQRHELETWQLHWLTYLYRRLGSSYRQPVAVWTPLANPDFRRQTIADLEAKANAQHWCSELVGTLKNLQQQGYIAKRLTAADLAHFCDSILHTDAYTRGNRRTQFSRKWRILS